MDLESTSIDLVSPTSRAAEGQNADVPVDSHRAAVIGLEGLAALVSHLQAEGRTVIGPTVRDGAIVPGEIDTIDDLPIGWTDDQEGGSYRLRRRADEARFGYAVGPQSWRRYVTPVRERLWRATKTGGAFDVEHEPPDETSYAFLGVRPCELAALAVQDRVHGAEVGGDLAYVRRRRDTLVIAVDCGDPASTCFCTSMGTGPKSGPGADLVLTEIVGDGEHRFLAVAHTDRGDALLTALPHRAAGEADEAAAAGVTERAVTHMGRRLDTTDLPGLLRRTLEAARWDDVASRCLSCANCTLVCPTCFCTDTEEVSDLTGDHTERWRRWDSCFSLDFSYLHGGSVRPTTRSRYRQWLTHKLGTWWDQFDVSGCVGCGRCITWCPVGIDLTEEIAALRAEDDTAGGDTR
jgi:ferredoxin